MIKQQQYNYKIILMSAIVSNNEEVNVWLGNDEFKPVLSEGPQVKSIWILNPDYQQTKVVRINEKRQEFTLSFNFGIKKMER